RQLLDGIAAIFEDALVAVDEGDGAAARGGVHECRVVGHQSEVLVADLDLAQVDGADGSGGDGEFVGFSGAIVGNGETGLRNAAATIAAVSARRRRGPSCSKAQLAFFAASSSSSVKPPSGPMRRVVGWRLTVGRGSVSASKRILCPSRPRMSSKLTGSSMCGMRVRPLCFTASKTILRQRSSLPR